MESAFEETYLWGFRATRLEVPMLVYMVSVMKRSRRHATMISSEMAESWLRLVAASRRWWVLMAADYSLFIVGKGERAAKTTDRTF